MMAAGLERRVQEAAELSRRWVWQGALSILDQGLVSGANFLMVMLFARWLAPRDYGAVAIGLSLFLLLANFHHALLLEPMSVLGPRRWQSRMGDYFVAILAAHAGAMVCLTAVLVFAGGIFWAEGSRLAPALLGLSISTPAVLSFWILRRICYVRADPAAALRGGASFFLSALLGVAVVRSLRWESPAALFVVTGGAALSAGIALVPVLRRLTGAGAPVRAMLGEALPAHWRYGRWMVGVSLTYWLANSAFAVLLGLSAGMAASAGLRAIENLATPVLQATGALSLLWLPWISGQTEVRGMGYLRSFQWKAMLAALLITGAYLGGVLVFRGPIMKFLYGPGAYASLSGLVPVVILSTLVRGVSELSVSTALKAAARPQAHFAASLLSAVFVLTGGWVLVSRWQVAGAAAAMLASTVLQAAVLAACFVHLTGRGERGRQGRPD